MGFFCCCCSGVVVPTVTWVECYSQRLCQATATPHTHLWFHHMTTTETPSDTVTNTVHFHQHDIHSCDSPSKSWLLGSVAKATSDHMMASPSVSLFPSPRPILSTINSTGVSSLTESELLKFMTFSHTSREKWSQCCVSVLTYGWSDRLSPTLLLP